MPRVLRYSDIVTSDVPYPHFVASDCFDPVLGEMLLHWFEREAAWKLHEVENFYRVYDLDLVTTPFPSRLSIMRQPAIYKEVRRVLEDQFDTVLSESPHVLIQKVTTCQAISPHNDWSSDGPSHRFIVQLNRGWKAEQGGLFTLLTDPNNSPSQALLPNHCSGFGFEISQRSYHAVTSVTEGDRYSIVFSYKSIFINTQNLPRSEDWSYSNDAR